MIPAWAKKRIMHDAPWPEELEVLVQRWRYRPGWTFHLHEDFDRGDGTHGTTLDIITKGYDSYHPDRGETYRVHHYRHVPAATFNRAAWLRWLFDQCVAIEMHEACEFAALAPVGGGECPPEMWERPFAPTHGPGDDPYTVKEYATDQQRRTRFTGEVKAED